MSWGAALQAEVLLMGNLKKQQRGPCRMLRGDAGGLQEMRGEKPAREEKQRGLCCMGLGEGGRRGGRRQHAPGSVLFRLEVFKLQIWMRKIVSSIQNSAEILLKHCRAVLWQLKSLAHKNLAQKLLLGFFPLKLNSSVCKYPTRLGKKIPPGSQWFEADPCAAAEVTDL